MKVINLLPKPKQKELHYEDQFRILVLFFAASMVTLALTLTGQVITSLYLANQDSAMVEEIDSLKSVVNKSENAELKAKIGKVNGQILDFKNLADLTPKWSKVILRFATLVPENMSINSFSSDIDKRKVDVSGFAKDRQAVIDFYNKVKEDTEYFTDINYPLENVAKPEDISFHFTFYINPVALK